MNAASEALLALRPVTFRYKPELDKAGIPQYGLVAEEVAEVNPDLVVRDENGEIYTVRYEAVNAMLLNEFLKEHRKVQEQEATIAQLKSTIVQQMEAVTAHLKEHDAQIQKVSAQLELTKPALQTVAKRSLKRCSHGEREQVGVAQTPLQVAIVDVALWATRDASHPPSQRYGVAVSEAATDLRSPLQHQRFFARCE